MDASEATPAGGADLGSGPGPVPLGLVLSCTRRLRDKMRFLGRVCVSVCVKGLEKKTCSNRSVLSCSFMFRPKKRSATASPGVCPAHGVRADQAAGGKVIIQCGSDLHIPFSLPVGLAGAVSTGISAFEKEENNPKCFHSISGSANIPRRLDGSRGPYPWPCVRR